MRLITQDQIREALSFHALIPALREGFADYARGRAHSAPITNIDFPEQHGEMHIKPGWLDSTQDTCVKVVTCYYDNPRRGLPTRDGCVLVADRADGRMKALLADGGLITDMRTAGASAVAVDRLQPREAIELGLVGTGTQALWHARAIACVRRLQRVRIWGRDAAKAAALAACIAEELRVEAEAVPRDAALACDVVVTATPAREPVVGNEPLKAGALIVAMGADAVGKRELGETAGKRITRFVADDAAQCRRYGELQWLPPEQPVLELGRLLAGLDAWQGDERDVVVFDSTGLGFQDAVGARLVLSRLEAADRAA